MTELARQRVSGAHYVYLELKRRIVDLEFEPGQRLFEPALASDLEVSRTPLREAIRRLISENLLEQQPTGGVIVPRLDARTIRELYDVRAALEGLTTGDAAACATDADIAALREIVARNKALVTFADDALKAGKSLHAKIMEIADNTWAIRLHEQVSNQMQRYRVFTNHTQKRRDEALADHQAIVEAIADHDRSKAHQRAYEHVLAAGDVAIRAITAGLDEG